MNSPKLEIEVEKKKSISPFEIARHLSTDTRYDWDMYAPYYNAFMINRIFSCHEDTLPFAHIMNKTKTLDKREQYDFYFYSIPKAKRYFPFINVPKDPDLLEIAKVYGVSLRVAREYAKLIQ